MRHYCDCCGQLTATTTCKLCGWVLDVNIPLSGYSRVNRKYLHRARAKFLKELPGRIETAIAAITR